MKPASEQIPQGQHNLQNDDSYLIRPFKSDFKDDAKEEQSPCFDPTQVKLQPLRLEKTYFIEIVFYLFTVSRL